MSKASQPNQWIDKTNGDSILRQKIGGIVREYTRLFPEEFALFKKAMKQKLSEIDQMTNKFAKMEGSDVIERKLAEWPATLDNALRMHLTREEYAFMQTQQEIFWFITAFPVFRITHKV